MLSPGPASLHRRIVDFDIMCVNRSSAARSKQILEKCDVKKLEKTCPVVYMLYVWVSQFGIGFLINTVIETTQV